jgi:hypothetical protein
MPTEEPHHTVHMLQHRLIHVEEHPIDALHLQGDVLSQHLSSSTRYGHHRLRRHPATQSRMYFARSPAALPPAFD